MVTLVSVALLVLLACGGDAESPPQSEQQETRMLPAFSVPVAVCMADRLFFPVSCNACLDAAVPRCFDQPDPGPRPEPAACRAPECEVPLAGYRQPPFYSSSMTQLRGACADGKTFEALMGALAGYMEYRRDGALVGAASYAGTIGKCECSGESFAGDVSCAISTYEVLAGPSPAGEPRLPFADGKPAAPCFCRD